jgi:photosystem I subunit V
MAACAATSRVTTTGVPVLSGSKKIVSRAAVQASFAGLRSGNRVDGLSLSRSRSFASRTAVAKSVAKTTCGLDTPVVISLSTGALLFLGRFVFLPFQRDNVSAPSLAFYSLSSQSLFWPGFRSQISSLLVLLPIEPSIR